MTSITEIFKRLYDYVDALMNPKKQIIVKKQPKRKPSKKK